MQLNVRLFEVVKDLLKDLEKGPRAQQADELPNQYKEHVRQFWKTKLHFLNLSAPKLSELDPILFAACAREYPIAMSEYLEWVEQNVS